jgi:ankyrin repeat domain-containing protein 50
VVRELLIHNVVDVNARNNQGNTALILASFLGHIYVIRELINHHIIDINTKGAFEGNDCSTISIRNPMRKRLTNNKLDVNVKDCKGFTALYRAIRSEQWDVVCELMKHEDVDLNVQGPLGFTPLMWASLKGRLDIVSMMLEDDTVDTDIKNIAGSTALDIALACQMFEVARCLEEHTKVCLRRRLAEQYSRCAVAEQSKGIRCNEGRQ